MARYSREQAHNELAAAGTPEAGNRNRVHRPGL